MVGSCFVCSKFGTTVLRNDADWFYACKNHLADTSFCKPNFKEIPPAAPTTAATSKEQEPDKNDKQQDEKNRKEDSDLKKKNTETSAVKKEEMTKVIVNYSIHSSFLYLRENQKKAKGTPSATGPRSISFPAVPNKELS